MKNLMFFFATALLTITLTFAISPPASADVPPPPVNQVLGLFDATIDFTGADIDREFCQQCHVGSQVERHHALVTPTFGCFECHTLTDGTFAEFRECTFCHQTSPHHTTAEAQARHCSACHGSLVADYDDGHYIPSYATSSFTPLTGGVEPDPTNHPGEYAGGCKACHMEDIGQGIASNATTHHGIGITECSWCHDVEAEATLSIRKCEDCHDVNSLHNIQADSDNDGVITPGTETGGYGHIGANADCYGCHVQSFLAFMSTTAAEPTIPSITSLSATVLTAGQAANLTIAGESFMNTSGGETFTPVVEITKGDNVVILYPLPAFTSKELITPVPATLEPGNYELRVKKDAVVSNKMTLTVAADVQVSAANLTEETIVITGSNFGNQPGETMLDNTLGTVQSWSDQKVVVLMPEAVEGQTVTLVTAAGAVDNTEITAAKATAAVKEKIKGRANKGSIKTKSTK